MQYFLLKLTPPRPTFPMDMSSTEAAIMEEHFVYWRGLLADSKAVVYGPVLDPSGVYGMAVLEVEDEHSAREVGNSDPTIKAGAGFSFQIHPMPDARVRPQR
ncbi:MAG TPA: YciI family protein [Gemmatimonadales bacterium]|nr:YciI family protein [Gemmatimonadales bacterium]